MTTKLWGIPGTSHVPSPEKELKKLIDKAKRDATSAINSIAKRIEKQTEQSMKRLANQAEQGLKRAVKESKHELTEATLDAERYITEAAEEAVDKVLEAIGAATVGELLNKLVDLAQANLIKKPVTVELFWFKFRIDVNDKIDALQRWADDPPTSTSEIPAMILELCADDDVIFCPNIPIVGRVEVTIGVDQIADVVKKAL